jgi:hypothetical protein
VPTTRLHQVHLVSLNKNIFVLLNKNIFQLTGSGSMPIYNYGLKWKFGVGARGQKGKQPPVHFGLQIGIYVLYGKDGKLM